MSFDTASAATRTLGQEEKAEYLLILDPVFISKVTHTGLE